MCATYRVIKCEISLFELKPEAAHLKQLGSLRAAFLRLTNTESLSEAQEKILLPKVSYASFPT